MKPTSEELEQIYTQTLEVIDADDITLKDLLYKAICEWEKIRGK